MSREMRRLHRKKTQFTNFSSSQPIESTEDSAEQVESEAVSSQTKASSHQPLAINDINAIRAELREDTYHAQLCESDFSDDTQDWGGENQDISTDYWHFVGSYD